MSDHLTSSTSYESPSLTNTSLAQLWAFRLLYVLASIPISLALLFLLSKRVTMPQTPAEVPVVEPYTPISFIVTIACAAVCLWIIWIARRAAPAHLFLIVSCAFFLLSLILTSAYSGYPRADAGETFEAMHSLLSEDFSPLQPGGYLHQYPHQLGLMYYYMAGHALFGGQRWIFYGNCVWALVSNFFLWQIIRMHPACNRLSESAAILFPLFFVPHVLFVLYGYNHLPSLALAMGAIFFALKAIQSTHHMLWLPSSLCLAIAVLIRQNFKIIAIALACVLFLALFRGSKLRSIFVIFGIFAAVFAAPVAVHKATEAATGVPIGQGIPTTAWIAMGLQDSRKDQIDVPVADFRLPGWFNGYTENLWEQVNYDSEHMSLHTREAVKKQLKARWDESDHGLQFFSSKVQTSWAEPTFQSLFVVQLPIDPPFFSTPLLRDLYDGGQSARLLGAAMRGVLILNYTLAFWGLCMTFIGKNSVYDVITGLIGLTVFGGFLFHLMWETKSLYIYPYAYMTLILAALAFSVTPSSLSALKRFLPSAIER